MIAFTWLLLLTSSQIGQVHQVFLSAFLPQGRNDEKTLTAYFNQKIIPRLTNSPLIIAALDRDQIVGFALFEKWENGEYYLAEMAVLPEYQRQGIGKKLTLSIFDKDPAAKKLVIVTDKDNVWARSFYEAIGFISSSFRHPDYPAFVGYEYTQ